jgi:hypothetical protein
MLLGFSLYIPAVKGGFPLGMRLLLAEAGSLAVFYFGVTLLASIKDKAGRDGKEDA